MLSTEGDLTGKGFSAVYYITIVWCFKIVRWGEWSKDIYFLISGLINLMLY